MPGASFTATCVTSRSGSSARSSRGTARWWRRRGSWRPRSPRAARSCSSRPSCRRLSVLLLGELLLEAGIPPGWSTSLPGSGRVLGKALAEHPDVDKIAFTGSTAVGKQLLRAAQGNLKRLSLELGGKSPTLIFADADLDEAIAGAAAGDLRQCRAGVRRRFARLCAARDLRRSLRRPRADRLALKLGPGLDADTQMGPLISEAHRRGGARASSSAAARRCARSWRAASSPAGAGFFYPATVVACEHGERAGRAGGDLRAGRHGDAVRRCRSRPCATRTTRSTASPRASGRATSRARIAPPRRSGPASCGSTATESPSSACRSAA